MLQTVIDAGSANMRKINLVRWWQNYGDGTPERHNLLD